MDSRLFPFLIGRIRTMNIQKIQKQLKKKVSIPHRQDKNLNFLTIILWISMFPFLIGRIRTQEQFHLSQQEQKQFPFLIGRIRTKFKVCKSIPSNMFPFLIGRIRTEWFIGWLLGFLKFPFLIGRIRTKIDYGENKAHIKVSIPHRQDKNQNVNQNSRLKQKKFPFLIGRIRTNKAHIKKRNLYRCFHSSQVG